jgi:hypothetical protein
MEKQVQELEPTDMAHTRTVRSERALDNEASARQIWDMAHGGVRAEGGTAHCQATDRSRGHGLVDWRTGGLWTVDYGLVDWWAGGLVEWSGWCTQQGAILAAAMRSGLEACLGAWRRK